MGDGCAVDGLLVCDAVMDGEEAPKNRWKLFMRLNRLTPLSMEMVSGGWCGLEDVL